MNFLKKYWPYSFESKTISNLITRVLIYALVAIVASVLMGILSKVSVLNVILFIIAPLIDIYVVVGVVLLLLSFFEIIK